MSDEEREDVSPSGSPIHRHEHRERSVEPAIRSEDAEILERHIETHLGPVEMVWHELTSDLVHIDVLHVGATRERPFHWLVTTGMSDRPKTPPGHSSSCRFAELMIALPHDRPIGEEAAVPRPARRRNSCRINSIPLARSPHRT